MNELEQEKLMIGLVPVIRRYWKSLDDTRNILDDKEILRLQAAFLNSYFVDLARILGGKKNGAYR